VFGSDVLPHPLTLRAAIVNATTYPKGRLNGVDNQKVDIGTTHPKLRITMGSAPLQTDYHEPSAFCALIKY